jgi:hypothetical protein
MQICRHTASKAGTAENSTEGLTDISMEDSPERVISICKCLVARKEARIVMQIYVQLIHVLKMWQSSGIGNEH